MNSREPQKILGGSLLSDFHSSILSYWQCYPRHIFFLTISMNGIERIICMIFSFRGDSSFIGTLYLTAEGDNTGFINFLESNVSETVYVRVRVDYSGHYPGAAFRALCGHWVDQTPELGKELVLPAFNDQFGEEFLNDFYFDRVVPDESWEQTEEEREAYDQICESYSLKVAVGGPHFQDFSSGGTGNADQYLAGFFRVRKSFPEGTKVHYTLILVADSAADARRLEQLSEGAMGTNP